MHEIPSLHDLRCEYLSDPLGIDESAPRLSWTVRSGRRGWTQSAYQVLVGTSASGVARGHGDLWDSGKVASNAASQIVYRGKPLEAGQECFWSVHVWGDGEAQPAVSTVARWEMGLLGEQDWQGSGWIGKKPASRPNTPHDTLDGSSWIWHPEAGVNPAVSAPKEVRWFRRVFTLPAGCVVKSARLAFTVDDAYDLRVNGHPVAEGGHNDDWRVMKVKDVAVLLTPGRNALAFAATNDGDAAGLACRLVITLDSGEPLEIVSDAAWVSSGVETAGWDGVNFDDHAWRPAQVAARMGDAPWGHIAAPAADLSEPAPHLRREFTLDGPIRRARVYACGIGYADIHVNGQRLGGDSERDPAYTAFDRRVLYVTYDATPLLKSGRNALGAILGTGWYDVHDLATWNFDRASWHGDPRLRLVLSVEYEDGREERIVSDDSWRAGTGPIVRDGIYSGEIYDARLEIPGWDRAGFDDRAWEPAAPMPAPADRIVARKCPPVAVTRDLAPRKIAEPKPSVYVLDFGQNFTGHVQLRLNAPAGTAVTLRYAEKVHPDGSIDQSNIDYFMTKTSPPQLFQTDTYICKGGGEEIWEQRFSYSGFRYAEVTGLPFRPEASDFRGRFAHTALEAAGEFSCSDAMLNKIQSATLWSYLSNAQSIPTDCPQREKNGWTADAHLAAEAGLMNFRTASFYTKWLDDIADNQLEDGQVGDIIPSGGWGMGGCHPAWDSAYAIIAWDLYRYCGDTRILARHYDRIARYVDYLAGRTEDGVIPFDSLGDWLPWKTEVSSKLTSTVFLYNDARILADAARILNREDDGRKYAALAEKTKQAFNAKWFERGVYANGEQTAQAMPLFFGMVPDGEQDAVFAALTADLEKQGHIDSGILGAKYIIRVLAQRGRSDLAYEIVTRKEQPSWAWWIEQGATTLWEDWQGKESLNHIMFGDVSNWFYQWIAGIGLDPASPGFGHILIQPQPVGGLTWARARYESPHGPIVSDWKKEGGVFHLAVSIPANATATISVPASHDSKILEGGRPVEESNGLRLLRRESGHAVYEAGSGDYAFAVQEG